MHRRDCPRLLELQFSNPEQIVEVPWQAGATSGFEVEIEIEAYDRQGLLRDVTELVVQAEANLRAVNTGPGKAAHTACLRLTLEMTELAVLGKLLDHFVALSNVISARRLTGADDD